MSPTDRNKPIYSAAFKLILISITLIFIVSCSKPDPIKIGFVGGLTGKISDLGIDGRNGVALAIEETNKAGGINGRKISLITKNDKQNATTNKKVINELISEGVEAIIGNMTSSMSKISVPIINKHKIHMISPTASTNDLTGIDDYFFRVYPASSQPAKILAQYTFQKMGIKKVSVIYDLNNRSHTESWLKYFKKNFEAEGGKIVKETSYYSNAELSFLTLAKELLSQTSECIFILAGAVDTAMFLQQFSKLKIKLPIIVSEWSATKDLMRFAGKTAEGITFFHTYDSDDKTTQFVTFKNKYFNRFGKVPSFASTHAHDAAMALINTLKINSDPSKIRITIQKRRIFPGLQGDLIFDQFGDVQRKYHLMTVRNGKFLTLTQ